MFFRGGGSSLSVALAAEHCLSQIAVYDKLQGIQAMHCLFIGCFSSCVSANLQSEYHFTLQLTEQSSSSNGRSIMHTNADFRLAHHTRIPWVQNLKSL